MFSQPAMIAFPSSPIEWALWGSINIAIFLVLKRAAGTPMAALGVATAAVGFAFDRRLYIPITVLATSLVYLLTERHSGRLLTLKQIAREVVLVGAGFGLYELGRKLTEGDAGTAYSNSTRVLDFERRLRLNFEPELQRMLLDYDLLVRLFSRIYSNLYLPVIVAGLIWLILADGFAYRVLRNSLGISALFGLLTFWLYPVAPPRLLPAADTLDMHALLGRQHGFMNEYAAVPSFHVGWTMLVGYVFFRTYRSHRWKWLAWTPGIVTLYTVMVTGNHYWFDGAVGSLYALVPAAILMEWPDIRRWWNRWMYLPVSRERASLIDSVRGSWWATLDVAALAGLLLYLIANQVINPGFTNYWGYMVAQIAATILTVAWLSQRFSAEGGLSPLTHVIIVLVTYADTLGTAAGFYDRFQIYDKFTHFGGGAILAAAAYEVLLSLNIRGAIDWSAYRRMFLAAAVSVVLGSIWEFYEVFGDAIFDTGRHAGTLDTIYDLISDSAGAILTVVLLSRLEPDRSAATPMNRIFGTVRTRFGRPGDTVQA